MWDNRQSFTQSFTHGYRTLHFTFMSGFIRLVPNRSNKATTIWKGCIMHLLCRRPRPAVYKSKASLPFPATSSIFHTPSIYMPTKLLARATHVNLPYRPTANRWSTENQCPFAYFCVVVGLWFELNWCMPVALAPREAASCLSWRVGDMFELRRGESGGLMKLIYDSTRCTCH
jgi:hypothetical protein